MKKSNLFWGLLLIAIGIFTLIDKIFNIHWFTMNNLWPLFILIPGLIFEFSFFVTKRDPGVLVPGGILTTIGLLFLFETFTDWGFAAYTWPIYPLAVAIGLFQLYLFGRRQSGLLIPVFILGGVSIIAFLSMFLGNMFYWLNYGLLLPIALIIVGILLLFRTFS
ncbi:LiaI-LiaF-like domain-containing protein [Clostridium omnivorum]|uniref:LiaI-LiaF-like transmembrane region domain-containing protein n=1 Tax=Clostridium omnivorum TaxID=1604902 RepID=A0ABQ5N208_9CLOT|nr:DUF5668 domain-containing protein [Clostridium sp. E14]GLC29216.1 hypothetical protein bsdE14_06260 [Clostridium sp. E14]